MNIRKKLVVDENGKPTEVILPWSQFCEMAEALGLDLDDEARMDLPTTRGDWKTGNSAAFVPASKV